MLTDGVSALYRVSTLASTEPVLKAAFEAWNASLPTVWNVTNIIWSVALEPLPPAIYARHAAENALGLSDHTESLVVALITVTWSDAADDALVVNAVDALKKQVDEAAAKLGGLDPFVYLNYAGKNQDPIPSYGQESVKRLQQVQKKVDPKKVFTYQVPGGYKIPG